MKWLRKVILWDYERGTWQYDLLCALIIAFVFLTPKGWFERELKVPAKSRKILVRQEEFLQTKEQVEKHVREIIGDTNAEVIGWRESRNEKGEVFYEIDLK